MFGIDPHAYLTWSYEVTHFHAEVSSPSALSL